MFLCPDSNMNVAGKRNYNGWILCPSKSFPGKFYYFNVLNGEAAWSLNELEQKAMSKSFIQRADKWHSYPEPDSPPADDAWTPYKSQSSFGNQVPSVFGQAIFPKYPTNTENYQPNTMWGTTSNQMIPMPSQMISINPQIMPMTSPIQPSQTGPMTFQMGHVTPQGHMQSQIGQMTPQIGHMTPQMGPMSAQMGLMGPITSQMGPITSHMGQMTSQMGQMTSQMGPMTSQMGPVTSQMAPITSQMGQMTSQMVAPSQIPTAQAQLTPPMYNHYGYNHFWAQEPISQPTKWIDKGNLKCQNFFQYNEGSKQWPSYQNQKTEKIMTGRNVFMPKLTQKNLEQHHTQAQTTEKQRSFNLRNYEYRSENPKVLEIPKINVVKNQRLVSFAPSRQLEPMLRKNTSFSERNIAENGLFPTKPVGNLMQKDGNFVNKQGYFGLQTTRNIAAKSISKCSEDINQKFEAQDIAKTSQNQKHPFVPSENSSTISNDDLPIKHRKTFQTSKCDESIDSIIQSKCFENLTVLEDDNPNQDKKVHPKNDIHCHPKNENEVEQVIEQSGLDKNDLRYTLLAKRKKPRDTSEQEKKTEAKKIKTSYTNDDYKPEPKRKRVTFKLEEEVGAKTDDQALEENGARHGEYSIQALRELGSLQNDEIWYIVVDTDVLIEDYDFIIELVSSDPTCILLIPDAVRREIEVLSRGDHRGRQRVLGARNLTRKLATPPPCVLFQDPDVEEMMTDFPVTDSIINCCLLMYNETRHAVLITNNEELHEKAMSSDIATRILNDIKAEALADKPEVSFEFRKIPKSNPEDLKSVDKMGDSKEKERFPVSHKTQKDCENNNYRETKQSKDKYGFPFSFRIKKMNSEDSNNNKKMANYEKERFPVNCFRKRLFIDSNDEITKVSTIIEIENVNLETNKQNIIQKNTITSTLEGHKFPPKTQRESEESSDLTLSSDVKREIQKFKNSGTKTVQIQKNVTLEPAKFNIDETYKKKPVQSTKNMLKPATFNYNKTLNEPEVITINDEKQNQEDTTFENQNQMPEVQKEDKSTASRVKRIKRINAYTIEAQIKFMFRVKSEMVAERIASRLDEWMCTFTQIMEDALTDILQQNSELVAYHPPPWTLLEAIEYVTEVFAEDNNSPIVTLVDKLARTLPQADQPNQMISPDDFMKILGCGILLIKYLNSILKPPEVNQELKQAEDFLLELLEVIEEPVGRDEDAPMIALGRNDADTSTTDLDCQERRNYVKNPAEVVEYLQRHFPAWRGKGKGRGYTEVPTSYYQDQDKSKVIRTCGRNVNSVTLNRTNPIAMRKAEDNDQSTEIDRQMTDNVNIESKVLFDQNEDEKMNLFDEKIEGNVSGPKLIKKLSMSSQRQFKRQVMKEIDIEKREASMRKMTDMLDNILDKGITKRYDLDSVIVNSCTYDENRISKENLEIKESDGQIDEYDRFEAFRRKQIELEAGIHLPVKRVKNQDTEVLKSSNLENWGPIVIQDKNTQSENCVKTSSSEKNGKDSNPIEEPKKEPQVLVRTNLVPYNRSQNKNKKNDLENINIKQEPFNKSKNKKQKPKTKTKVIKEPQIQEPGVTSNTIETKKEDNIDSKNTKKDMQINDLDALDYSAMDEESDHPVYPDHHFVDIDNLSFGNMTVSSSSRLVIVEDIDYNSHSQVCNSTKCNKDFEDNTQSMDPLDKKSFDALKMFFVELSECFTSTFDFVQKNVEDFKDLMLITEERRVYVRDEANKIQDHFSRLLDKLQCVIEKVVESTTKKWQNKLMMVDGKLISGGVIERCVDQARIIKGQLLYLMSLAEGSFDMSLTSTAGSIILPCHNDHSKINSSG